jgi:hypothetical protein
MPVKKTVGCPSYAAALLRRVADCRQLPFAKMGMARWYFTAMSTLVEIQDAVAQLPNRERKALQLWLNSQSDPELTALKEQRLLRSLDEAVHDIDAGKGVSIDEVRKRVGTWAAK